MDWGRLGSALLRCLVTIVIFFGLAIIIAELVISYPFVCLSVMLLFLVVGSAALIYAFRVSGKDKEIKADKKFFPCTMITSLLLSVVGWAAFAGMIYGVVQLAIYSPLVAAIVGIVAIVAGITAAIYADDKARDR